MAKNNHFIKSLYLDKSQLVKEAILKLIESDKKYEKELIELVNRVEEEESLAPLWAAIILGEIKSERAIPALIELFKTDYDFLLEAAGGSLIKISQINPDLVAQNTIDFIEWELSLNNPSRSGRIYAYGVLIEMLPNPILEKYLLEKFEEDELNWTFAVDLARYTNKNFQEMLKRELTIAKIFGDQITETEFKEAYRILDGNAPEYLFKKEALWRLPWPERWKNQLENLDLTEEEYQAKQKEMAAKLEELPKKIEKGESEYFKKMKEDVEALKNYPISSFNLENYLKIRERKKFEVDFQGWLSKIGLSMQYSVEDVQLMIDKAISPSEILERPPFQNLVFSSEEEFKKFTSSFMILWNNTPRSEFEGLSPQEKMEYE